MDNLTGIIAAVKLVTIVSDVCIKKTGVLANDLLTVGPGAVKKRFGIPDLWRIQSGKETGECVSPSCLSVLVWLRSILASL